MEILKNSCYAKLRCVEKVRNLKNNLSFSEGLFCKNPNTPPEIQI